MIKHIIFDFGGVILDMGADAGMGKKTTGIPDDLAEILQMPKETITQLWTEHKTDIITGYETPKNFLHRVRNLLKIDVDIDAAYQQWEQRYALKHDQINWDLVKFIQNLKPHYQIHLLTDAIDISRGDAPWIEDIDALFDSCFRSYEQHLKKPNQEAYQNVLDTIHAMPEECIFIDDVQINIDGAAQLGINACLYQDLPTLKKYFYSQHC